MDDEWDATLLQEAEEAMFLAVDMIRFSSINVDVVVAVLLLSWVVSFVVVVSSSSHLIICIIDLLFFRVSGFG